MKAKKVLAYHIPRIALWMALMMGISAVLLGPGILTRVSGWIGLILGTAIFYPIDQWGKKHWDKTTSLFVLLFVGAAFGRPLVVLAADPNSCGPQPNYALAVPWPIPDPNVAGTILGPVPGNAALWDIQTGSFKRDWARACDPENDAFSIRYVQGTSPALPQLDPTTGQWTFAAEAIEGLNAWQFEASDGKDARLVWIVAWGLHNDPPILE